MLNTSYKNDLIHLREYVLTAFILWHSLLKWLTAGDEIRVFAFDIHFICSRYGFKHNLRQIMKFVFTIGLLSINIYMTVKWLANRFEVIVLELDMKLTGNHNSLSTWVRPAEVVRVLTLEVQPNCSLHDLDTRLALCIVYETDI